MTLVLGLSELAPALALLEKFTSDRDIVPGLRHVWFTGSELRASTGVSGAIVGVSWSVPEPFALPAGRLTALVSSLHAQGHARVALEARETSFGITSEKFQASLPRYRPAEGEDLGPYVLRRPPAKNGRTALTPAWWADLSRALPCMSADETKAPLRGVRWAKTGALYATDTYRLTAVLPEKSARALPPGAGVLLPDHLLSRVGARRVGVTEACVEGDAALWLFAPDGAFYGTLIAGDFPEEGCATFVRQARRASAEGGTWVELPVAPVPLASVLERLLHFAEAPTYRLGGEARAGALRLFVGNEAGSAEEVLPATVRGPDVSFEVNGEYLREALLTVAPKFWIPGSAGGNAAYFASADGRVDHLVMLLRA